MIPPRFTPAVRRARKSGLSDALSMVAVALLVAGCTENPDAPPQSPPRAPADSATVHPTREHSAPGGLLRLSDLDGTPIDLFGDSNSDRSESTMGSVFIFVCCDCPIANRYAPVIRALDETYRKQNVTLWLVYPDAREDADKIRTHLSEYGHITPALRDPEHLLVARCQATTTPEAAVFDSAGELIYHGRIDDRHTDLGKSRSVQSENDLENAIADLLAGKPVKSSYRKPVGCYIPDTQK